MTTRPERQAKPPQRPVGIEPGDHVYVQHPERGPVAVKVLATGAHGLTGRCDQGGRHKVTWDRVLGHKARMLNRYKLVDQGADGAILEDDRGRRRYVSGELPDTKDASAETPSTASDDSLLGGARRIHKAIGEGEKMLHALPDGARIVFLKAETAVKKERKEKSAAPPMKHGDTVTFRHGDVEGTGKIVASGADGVTVQSEDGREHHVRHEHLTGPKAAEGGKGADRKRKRAEEKDGADEMRKALDALNGRDARVIILAGRSVR